MDAAVMFSGGCGTSVGAEQAGASIVWAANHSQVCVDVHRANFPECETVCQDLHLFNHAAMLPHDALLASPVCRANSKASQPGRARARSQGTSLASAHNAYRSLPWSVIDALEVNLPRVFVVENVPEWRDWIFFNDWVRMVRRLGYRTSTQVLDSLAWGVPQSRERLFVIGHRGGRPIRVRDPKGADPSPCAEAIDWDSGDWMPFSACRGDKARAQLERCDREFGGAPSWVQLVGHRPVSSADSPVSTMTRQDQWRWVYRGKFRYPTAREAFTLMGFPRDYILPDVGRTVAWAMAGDAVCPPVMRGIMREVMSAV